MRCVQHKNTISNLLRARGLGGPGVRAVHLVSPPLVHVGADADTLHGRLREHLERAGKLSDLRVSYGAEERACEVHRLGKTQTQPAPTTATHLVLDGRVVARRQRRVVEAVPQMDEEGVALVLKVSLNRSCGADSWRKVNPAEQQPRRRGQQSKGRTSTARWRGD